MAHPNPMNRGPVDPYGRYTPHGPNPYVPNSYPPVPQPHPAGFARRGNGFATASLTLGILTVLGSWYFLIFGTLGAIAGIIFGSIGLSQHRRGLTQSGQARSIIGIILSSLALVIAIIFAVLVFMIIMEEGGGTLTDPAVPDSGIGENESFLDRSHDRYMEHT